MRTPSAVLYGSDYTFEFGKGCIVRDNADDVAVIVSSGRGVHEALAAATECSAHGLHVGVVDMPSIDEDLLVELCNSGKVVCLAEQNNGFILHNLLKTLYRRRVGRYRQRSVDQHARCRRPAAIHPFRDVRGADSCVRPRAQSDRRSDRQTRSFEVAMSVPALHEDDVEALGLPGRQLSWLVARGALAAEHCSACVIRVAPGDKVRPAHSHPNGEEVIYVIQGSGRVMVEGEVVRGQGGIDGAFSPRRGSHAAQHRQRRNEGRVLLRAGDQPRELQDVRGRRLPE